MRELQHLIERVVVLGEKTLIDLDEIQSAMGLKKTTKQMNGTKDGAWKRAVKIPREGLSLKEGEMQLISEILRITRGNKTHASKILGISRPRLNRKIDEYRISWK
ncbi:MAG: helix-turn-helix domain-containing protein [bacterium]